MAIAPNPPVEVAPGIYRVLEPLDGRALAVVLVVDGDEVVLVDAGVAGTPRRIVFPALSALGLRADSVRHVVITHSDIDHSGGLGDVHRVAPRAVSVAHRLDIPWIEDVGALIEERYCSLRARHGIAGDDAFFAWVRASDSGARIDVAVTGGELLRLRGGRTLELVHVPGHSRGHLAVVDHATRTGLIGDAVFGRVTPALDGSGAVGPGYYDAAAYRRTVKRLAGLDLDRLVGAHYPVMEGAEARAFLADSASFCDDLESAVLSALRGSGPLTTREVVEVAAPAVRAWPPEADLGISVAVVAHLRDLENQGLVRELPGDPARWEET